MKDAGTRAASELVTSMAEAARGVIGSLTSIATSQASVNFSAQREQVKAFESSVAHFAVAAGQDLSKISADFEATGLAIGKRPQEVAAWSTAVGKLTYNLNGTTDSMRSMSALAAKTGRTVEDYQGLAVQLGRMGVEGKNTADVISNMQGAAESFGTIGGVAALAGQFEALGDMITFVSGNADKAAMSMTNFIAGLTTGLNSANAQRVGGAAVGYLQQNGRAVERYLHREIMDKHGHVPNEDMGKIYQDMYKKSQSHGKGQRAFLINTFGPELGSEVYNQGKEGRLGKDIAIPSGAASLESAEKKLLATPAGKRDIAEAQLAISAGDLLKSSSALGKAADMLQAFAAKNPFVSSMGAAVGGKVAEFAGTKALKFVAGKVGAGGLGAIEATAGAAGMAVSAAAIATSAIALVGVGALGGIGYFGAKAYQAGNTADKQRSEGAQYTLDIESKKVIRKEGMAQLEMSGKSHNDAVLITQKLLAENLTPEKFGKAVADAIIAAQAEHTTVVKVGDDTTVHNAKVNAKSRAAGRQ